MNNTKLVKITGLNSWVSISNNEINKLKKVDVLKIETLNTSTKYTYYKSTTTT
jgi:DNA-binding Xre family transcriptional regulator